MSKHSRNTDPVEELAAVLVRTSFSPSPSSAPLDGLRPHKIPRGPKSSFTMTPQESELDTSDEELRLLSTVAGSCPSIMPTINEEHPSEVSGNLHLFDDDFLGSSEDTTEYGLSQRPSIPRVPSVERTSYSYRRRLKRTCADLFDSVERYKGKPPKIVSPNSFVGLGSTDRNPYSGSQSHHTSKTAYPKAERRRRHSVSTSPLSERVDERSMSPTDQSHRRRFETEPSRDPRDK